MAEEAVKQRDGGKPAVNRRLAGYRPQGRYFHGGNIADTTDEKKTSGADGVTSTVRWRSSGLGAEGIVLATIVLTRQPVQFFVCHSS